MKLYKTTNKKISVTNYIIILSVFLVSVFSVLLLRNIYLTREENELNKLVLEDVLTNRIMINEVDNYIDENPDTIMYIGIGKDEFCRKFEKSIKKYLINNELNNEIIYLNLSEEEKDNFLISFNNNYKSSVEIKDYPLVISFKNGNINKVLQKDITKDDFSEFIDEVRNEE